MVAGLAAGSHLWLSGTGARSATTFSSHLGDLPDLEVDADGTARKEIVAARLTLADVVDRAFIVHASRDDDSPRLACAPFK
jgi:Cu-Zn family superoxide dismutase